MIGIRADANEHISMGHVMRCMTIADALKDKGEDVIFIISDPETKEFITGRGYENICLNNDYTDKDSETCLLKDIIIEKDIKCMLLDSYEVTPVYMKELMKMIPVVYIDDIMNFDYSASVIINYSIDASSDNYQGCACDSYLLGSRYTPLRREFRMTKRGINDQKKIMVTSGGSDPYNALIRISEGLLNSSCIGKDVCINVIAGRFCNNIDKLQKLADANIDRMKVYINVPDIWNVMAESYLAVSASGTTVAELCSMGIPVINYIIADNQINGVNALLKHDAIVYAGDMRNDPDDTVSKAVDRVRAFIDGELDYEHYSNIGKELYDGNGAARIAEKIVGLI